jgi:hypothetical protein
MDAYDKHTNLGNKKILPLELPSMVKAKNFSDHPRSDVLIIIIIIIINNNNNNNNNKIKKVS